MRRAGKQIIAIAILAGGAVAQEPGPATTQTRMEPAHLSGQGVTPAFEGWYRNPDGSAGSCTTCHGRHRFELADARQPTVCMTCHLSDGSAEAWQRSPHGGFFLTSSSLETAKGPSCTVCHMASRTGAPTHDVSARVSWAMINGKLAQRPDADARRDSMTSTCLLCHGGPLVEAAFDRIDDTFNAGVPSASPPPTAPYLKSPAAWPHLSPADRYELAKMQGRLPNEPRSSARP